MTSFIKSPTPTLPGLAEMAAGSRGPILLIARNSGVGGVRARKQVAKEAHDTGEDLFRMTGIDIRHLIPSREEIVRKLKYEPTDRIDSVDEDGKKFTNEYLLLSLSPEVYLLVSTGSGSKIDEDLNQPWLDYLNDCGLKALKPRLVVWHRGDRVFRTFLLSANTLHICTRLDIKMYDGEHGLLDGDFATFAALFRAKDSADEAARIPKKTRDGQVDATGTDMSTGSVPYAIARVAPAGTMALRMKAPNGLKGEPRLFFDTPSGFPRESEVAYGLPEVYEEIVDIRNNALDEFEDDIAAAVEATACKLDREGHEVNNKVRDSLRAEFGAEMRSQLECDLWEDIAEGRIIPTRIDQVANVRLAFSLLGLPNWSINAVGRLLMKRGFSTARLRMDNTPGTTFSPDHIGDEVDRVMRPLIAQREFYRTGTLHVKLGVKGVKDFDIVGCFPPDGPWGTDDDFDRVEKCLADTTGGGPATQGLTGVIFRSEQGDLPLRSAPTKRQRLGPAYVVRPAEAGVRGCISLPPIPHSLLAESIVKALIKHAGQLLTPLVHVEPPGTALLRHTFDDAEKAERLIRASCDAMLDSLGAIDQHGKTIGTPETIQAVFDRHARRSRDELDPARARTERAKSDLDAALRTELETDPAVHSGLLLKLVESLRDALDTTYNDLWKGAVVINSITRMPAKSHDTSGTVTRWEGTLRITGADREFSAPFGGEFLDGAVVELSAKVDHALTQLLAGVPFYDIVQTNARGVRLALAERLGFDSRYFGLPTCTEPRLVRIAAHVAADLDRDVTRVSGVLNEDLDLVQSVLAQLTSGRPTWDSVAVSTQPSKAA